MKKFLTTLSLIALTACGGGKSDKPTSDRSTINGSEFVMVNGELDQNGNAVSGNGSFSFVTPRPDAGNSYALKFAVEDGGSLSLIANAAKKLEGGVVVTFTRSGTVLNATLANGNTVADVSDAFADIDANGEVSVQIDIHNDENPVHILVWSADAASFDEESALLNTEDAGVEVGAGVGNLWGFKLNNATLLSAVVTEPKFEEE